MALWVHNNSIRVVDSIPIAICYLHFLWIYRYFMQIKLQTVHSLVDYMSIIGVGDKVHMLYSDKYPNYHFFCSFHSA